MKKIALLIMMVIMSVAPCLLNVTNASTPMNKGSSMVEVVIMPSAETVIDLTVETPADSWVQQNSSSTMVPSNSGGTMNNSQELVGTHMSPRSLNFVMMANSLPGAHDILQKAQVTKIPNMAMILNSSNALVSQNGTQWRQPSIDMMTNTTASRISNGANVCAVKKVNSYNFLFRGSLIAEI